MNTLRTPLARARGVGAAHHGVGHWLGIRLTGVAMVPMVAWAGRAALHLARSGYAGAVEWIGSPVNATLTIILIALGFFHMHNGVPEVVMDYIERPISKIALLVLNFMLCVLGAGLAIVSILKVALGGAL